MKTVYEHILSISSESIRTKLLNNIAEHMYNLPMPSVSLSIKRGFLWRTAPEGQMFWVAVHEAQEQLEKMGESL